MSLLFGVALLCASCLTAAPAVQASWTDVLPRLCVWTHLCREAPASPVSTTPTTPVDDDYDCSDCVCGLGRRAPRVVGGLEAREAEFPWMAALVWRHHHKGEDQIHCGGALITRRHVLTAAHCVHALQPSEIGVVLGARSRRGRGRVERRVRAVWPHERFEERTLLHDIAVLELDRAVALTEEDGLVRTVCLPAGERDLEGGALATVAGWGLVDEAGDPAGVLRKVRVPLLDQEACRRAGRAVVGVGEVSDTMLCAGFAEGMRDACEGDSGGPLILGAEYSPSSEVIGVVSWGMRGSCARAESPGVYTRVDKYLPWIRKKIRGSCVCEPAGT